MDMQKEIDRLRAERKLIKRLDTIRDESVNVKEIFTRLSKEIFSVTQASFCLFFLCGKKGQPHIEQSFYKNSRVLRTYAAKLSRYIIEHELKDKSSVLLKQHDDFDHARMGSIILVPIIPNNNLVGYIAAGTERNVKLTLEDCKIFELISEQIDKGVAYALLSEELKHANSELEQRIEDTKVLYRITRELSATVDLQKLLKTVLLESTRLMKVERASVLLFDMDNNLQIFVAQGNNIKRVKKLLSFKEGEGVAGQAIAAGKPYIANEGYNDPVFKKVFSREKHIRNMLCYPLIHRNKKLGVINLVNTISEEPFRSADIQRLVPVASQIALTLSNFIMYQDLLQKREMEKELKLAKMIQMQLLPEKLPTAKGKVTAAALTIPSHVVGGDYYDFVTHDKNCLGFCIADVSGKGIPAAMVLTVLRNSLHVLADSYVSPSKIIAKMNNIIHNQFKTNMFVTMFYGIFNPRDYTLKYSNAGHNSPILMQNGKFSYLEAEGLPCGLFEDCTYVTKKIQLTPKDKILLYTDGITEAMNESNTLYGEKRFETLFKSIAHQECVDIIETVRQDVFRHIGSAPQNDDVTMVAIKIK